MRVRMKSKALIVVGLAAVIAATTGVAFASNSNSHPRGADSDPVATVAQGEPTAENSSGENYSYTETQMIIDSADPSVTDNVTENDISATTAAESTVAERQTSETTSDGNSFNVLPNATYKIQRVLDRSTGEEQLPQVVFGKYYSSCYLTLYNNCTAEICLNPSSGVSETGSYSIYNSIMYVDFGKDRLAEYNVVYNDENTVNYIIVPSGEYDVYFG